MDLYLIRHAPAVPLGEAKFDNARPLSPKGRIRFSEVVDGLEELGTVIQRVYHSPWVRARQTAELLMPIADRAVETEGLAQSPSERLLEELEGDAIALVGHQPWMGQLAALLTTGDPALGTHFPFKKGAVAHLSGEPRAAGCALVSMMAPRALRRLAG